MKVALEALAPLAGRLDTVIWAGIGHGAALESVRALGGRQYYLEPHPGLRRRVEARIATDPGVSVQGTPLWKSDGKALFHVANDAVSSTLLPPEDAWAGRPNVRVVQDIEVETESLATLLDSLALDERASALLILDIGGGEDDLLAGCEDAALLRLGQVLVPAGCEKAAARLRGLGFDRDPAGEDWWLLRRPAEVPRDFEGEIEQLASQLDVHAVEREQIESARQRAIEAMETLRQQNAGLEAERDEARTALAAVTRERDEQAALAAMLRERLSTSEQQAMTTVGTLRGERDAEATRATSLQQKLTTFSQESAQTIAALTRERDTAIGSLAKKTSLAEQLEASRSQLQDRADKLEAELQEARRTVALSLKLQAQRDADLDDLQARYRESQEVQERQRQLLERVGERLGVASRYFHQLADERGKE